MMPNNDLPDEARRYDGAPAPERNTGIGIADAKAAAEDARRAAECEECGHGDYEGLTKKPRGYMHSCSAHQQAQPKPMLLCEDCAEDHTPKEDFLQSKRESDTVYVLFECGITQSADEPESEAPVPHPVPATIPVKCRCGAEIEDILY